MTLAGTTRNTRTPSFIRVAVADDHHIVRSSLRQYLGEHPGIRVIGECATGREAVEMVRTTPMDVLVLDIAMPGQSGLDSMPRIRARAPRVAILVLTGYPAEQYAVKALRLGASAFLNKQCEPGEIVEAVRTLATGRRYLPPDLAALVASSAVDDTGQLPHQALTGREFQVLLKLAAGMKSSEIAAELSLSAQTVSGYRARLMAKLGLHSNSELTRYALTHKLID